MRVTDAKPLGQGLEPRVGHFVQIANSAVRNGTDTAQCAMSIGIHFPPKRTNRCRFVQILNHNNLWAGQLCDVGTILSPIGGGLGLVVGIAGFDFHRDRPANHRPHLRHEISRHLVVNPSDGRIEFRDLLPAVVNRRRVPSL